jgi:hypothetical protein
MNRRLAFAAALLFSIALLPSARANSIAVTAAQRKVTAAESSAATLPAPANGEVYQFFVTTDSDLLVVYNVLVSGPAASQLFQNDLPTVPNDFPPPIDLAGPSKSADSFIDTPGTTARLGPDLPGDGVTGFGDFDNNGPQTNFQFAQLTVPAGVGGSFQFTVSILDTTRQGDFYAQSFQFPLVPIPEPASATLLIVGLVAVTRSRRRPRS